MATVREQVLLAIANAKEGMTTDEVENWLGLSHQTASARVHDLAAAGLITKTKTKRPTRSGGQAFVYVAAKTERVRTNDEKAFKALLGVTVRMLEEFEGPRWKKYAKEVEAIVRAAE